MPCAASASKMRTSRLLWAVAVRRTYRQWSVLEKGVAVGERVVTDGQLRLAPGAKVAIKKAG